MIEADWRVDKPRSIHFGSSFSERVREKRLAELVGLRIASLSVDPNTKELCVHFSDGRVLRTFTEWQSQPAWTVLVHDLSRIAMDGAWEGVDVIPCFHIRAGRPQIEYDFDEETADLTALKRRYGF